MKHISFFICSFFIPHSLMGITLKDVLKSNNKNYHLQFLLDERRSKQFILQLPNATVIRDGGVITQDGQIFEDTIPYSVPIHDWLPKRAGNDLAKALANKTFFDGTLVVLSSLDHDQWYHWLLQLIPRLKILADSGIAYDKIHIYKLKERWQKETLFHIMNELNIPTDKLLEINNDLPVQAKHLIVPSIPYNRWHKERNSLPLWLKEFLRTAFIRNSASVAPAKRIYISRANARIRKILNEDELITFLESKGFITLQLEELSIFDQAYYFNNAEYIIGSHGSGLANAVFCKPLTKVIELNYNKQYRHFSEIARMMACVHIPYQEKIIYDRYENYPIDMAQFKKFCTQKLRI